MCVFYVWDLFAVRKLWYDSESQVLQGQVTLWKTHTTMTELPDRQTGERFWVFIQDTTTYQKRSGSHLSVHPLLDLTFPIPQPTAALVPPPVQTTPECLHYQQQCKVLLLKQR